MDHNDHLNLIRNGTANGGVWAEFGSGSGHFTAALAELLGSGGILYSVDKNKHALQTQERRLQRGSSQKLAEIRILASDYTHPLPLPPLDGLLMVNALHFQENKITILKRVLGSLKPGGCLLLVEYNTDHGNRWVPYPISYRSWERLSDQAGFTDTKLLHTVPSSFLGEIFASASYRAREEPFRK